MTTKRFSQLRKPKNGHLSSAQFGAYEDGTLSEAEAAAYRQHLASCPACKAWVYAHYAIAQQLRNESSPPTFLSPAAAARIQLNMSSRMRRALIMNNMKAFVAGTAVIAVLALIVGIFAWQMRSPETPETVEPAIQNVAPDATVAPEALNEQLIAAVEAADATEVERLLQAGADPNLPDSEGNALLPQAAHASDLAMVEALVNAGAELDGLFQATVDGNELRLPALSWAALDNHIEIAEFLIARGADVDEAAPLSGNRPVHIAAMFNHPQMIALLLDHGSDPDETNVAWGDAGTPLHVAIMYGSVEAMRALLDGGARVNLRFGPGNTLLMLVQYQTLVAQPERRDELTTLLLEYGADPNLLDDNGSTALHHAARWDRVTTIPLLVEHGASLNVQNVTGKTPLDLATDPAVIELLQDLGAKPAAASGSVSELSPDALAEQLVTAVAARDAVAVEQLLEAGADPNTLDAAGDPLLRLVLLDDSADIVATLIDHGADVNALDSRGDALLPQAARAGQLEAVRLLLDAGAEVDGTMNDLVTGIQSKDATSLFLAAAYGYADIARLLVKHGANVNHQETNWEQSPIHAAAWMDAPDIIQLLLDNGAEVNRPCSWRQGETPLHYAVDTGSIEAIHALLDGGAEVDIQTELGRTPLINVVLFTPAEGQLETLATLLDAGADPNIPDNSGNTALHRAVMANNIEVVRLLLEVGADLNLQNNAGRTALDLAVYDEIADILREAGASE